MTGHSIHIAQILEMVRKQDPGAFSDGISREDPLRIRFSMPEFDDRRLKRELWSTVDGWDVSVANDLDGRLYEIAVL